MGTVTILYQNTHTRGGEGGWYELELPHQVGLPIKYYLQRQQGLLGVLPNRKLKVMRGDGSYQWIRLSYVPKEGDVVALAPKEW